MPHPDSSADQIPAQHGFDTPGDEVAQQHPEGNFPVGQDDPRQGVPVDDGEPSYEAESE